MSKRLIILGGGESGVGAAILGSRQGYDVFLSDGAKIPAKYVAELNEYAIRFEEGGHSEDIILAADEIIKSPGIPEKNELVKKIRAKGIRISSEIELAYRHKGTAKIAAITGSNGKTTTTTITGQICLKAGVDCAVVGNIGYSFARQVAIDPKEWYIVEISSFQLDD
ncbi:MAG: UDP-N-acetylmuramoyl-L-alanine--D-glutamate ligase, partial [Sphingobacteriales bacterium]